VGRGSAMTQHDERAINQFRRRVGALLALRQGVGLLTFWCFLWGTSVLILRATLATPRPLLLWGLAAVPVLLLAAAWLAWRRLPARSSVRALLDRDSACGGLLMASEETDARAWRERVPTLRVPRVSWQGGRAGVFFAASVAFLLFGFLLPQRYAAFGSRTPLNVDRETEKLVNQIEILKEEALLDPARAEKLKEKLQQLRDEASGKDPAKTLEALDHVQEMVERLAKAAAEKTTRQTEKMNKTQTLAEGLKQAGDTLDAKTQTQAMKELAEMTKKAAEDNAMLQKELEGELGEAGQDGKFDKQQLDKLCKALGKNKDAIAKKLSRLQKAGLLDAEALEKCAKCGE